MFNLFQKTPEEYSSEPHDWELISKTYAPPRKDLTNVPSEYAEKAMFGVTTLLWQCKIKGETKKEEVLGTDENQLEEMLANATALGPQYLERPEGMYVIARWQTPQGAPQQQQEAPLIPLR